MIEDVASDMLQPLAQPVMTGKDCLPQLRRSRWTIVSGPAFTTIISGM
jgi:hypothetical protein